MERILVTRRQLVIGLPGSGKTTFLAALWHVVQSEEIASALRLHKMDGDRTFLNDLRDAWLQCKAVQRTNPKGERLVNMLLADADDTVHELTLPDISGETFREQWAHREWARSYDEMVARADGVLIFVRPGAIVEPLSLSVATQLVADVEGDAVDDDDEDEDDSVQGIGTAWNPIESPTQVQLVDLVQLLRWRRPEVRWQLALVVSAWDEAKSLRQTPAEWCRARLPLLDQYLEAQRGRMSISHYGISAQGGPLPADAERLRAITLPSERIEVVAPDGSISHDITLPLRDLAQAKP